MTLDNDNFSITVGTIVNHIGMLSVFGGECEFIFINGHFDINFINSKFI